jgi:UDP-glucose 4-epimerase
VTGKSILIDYVGRRDGDPAILAADATLARSVLGWSPQYTEIETIVNHAWEFEEERYINTK